MPPDVSQGRGERRGLPVDAGRGRGRELEESLGRGALRRDGRTGGRPNNIRRPGLQPSEELSETFDSFLKIRAENC